MIFLAGPHGVGKTHATRLLEKAGFYSLDLGPIIRKIHKDSGTPLSLKEWVVEGEQKSGPDFTNQVICKEVVRHLKETYLSGGYQGLIISGSRSIRGMLYLKHALRSILPQELGWLVYLDAPKELLYERYVEREKVSISREQFGAILDVDAKMGLYDMKALANAIVINDADSDYLETQLNTFLTMTYQLQDQLIAEAALA